MSKNRPLSQPKVLHVVIMHASHRYILCWYILCWYILCVLCAVYFAAVSHVRFVTICRAAICFVSIYTVCFVAICRAAIYTVQHSSMSSRQKENPAETLHTCAVYAASQPDSGRNFTHMYRKSRFRAKKRQKLYSYVKKRSFAHLNPAKTLRECRQKARAEVRSRKKRQKLCSRAQFMPHTHAHKTQPNSQ